MHGRRSTARRGALLCWGVAALLAIGILFGTLTPSDTLPDMDGGLDKLWHLVAFAALVFPPVLWRPRNALLMVPFASAFGLGIEVIQPLFGRGFEWSDWIADTVGAMVGATLAVLLHRPAMRLLRR